MAIAYACSSTRAPEGKFIIEGYLENVQDSALLSLYDMSSHRKIMMDTLSDGHFILQDTISDGCRRLFILPTGEEFSGMKLDIWVRSGSRTVIKGKSNMVCDWDITTRVPEQEEANAINRTALQEKKAIIECKLEQASIRKADIKPEKRKRLTDSLRGQIYLLDSIVRLKELQFMESAPVSEVWMYKLLLYSSALQWAPERAHKDILQNLYNRLSEKELSTETGKKISAYFNLPPTVSVGDYMADGDLYDTDGNPHHLAEFKGKYILVDFWSKSCGPCIRSIPELEEVSHLYEGKMTIVSISQDKEDIWKAYVKEKGLKGNQWNGLAEGIGGLEAAYQAHGVPHYVMISPDGTVSGMWSGYAPGYLKSKVKEYLEQ